MSKETREWLSNNVLIGFTEKRGKAWHYREGDDNHYVGPVPVKDVERRLFDWDPVSVPLQYTVGDVSYETDDQVIIRSDNHAKLGVFGGGAVPHPYREWLLGNLGQIIDDDLSIGSAGLLRGGAVAWVQIETPDNMTTTGGIEFRPFINAFGSLDGSFATTYKLGITNVVCDNTMRAAQNEKSPQVRIKQTVNSAKLFSAQKVRGILGIVHDAGDAFSAEVNELLDTEFTDAAFERLTADLTAVPDDAGKRAQTMADKKRDTYLRLWRTDERVAPWSGTAWGAWQAMNTTAQHEGIVRGGNRAERNMLSTLSGKFDEQDTSALQKIMAYA